MRTNLLYHDVLGIDIKHKLFPKNILTHLAFEDILRFIYIGNTKFKFIYIFFY